MTPPRRSPPDKAGSRKADDIMPGTNEDAAVTAPATPIRRPHSPQATPAARHNQVMRDVNGRFSRDNPVGSSVQPCAIPTGAKQPAQYDEPCNLTMVTITQTLVGATRTVRIMPKPPPGGDAMILGPGGTFAMLAGTPAAASRAQAAITVSGAGFCGAGPHPSIHVTGFVPPLSHGATRTLTIVQAKPLDEIIRNGHVANLGPTQLLSALWTSFRGPVSHDVQVESCGLPLGPAPPVPVIAGRILAYHNDEFELTYTSKSALVAEGERKGGAQIPASDDDKPENKAAFTFKRNADDITYSCDFMNYINMVKYVEKTFNDIMSFLKNFDRLPGPKIKGRVSVLSGELSASWRYVEVVTAPTVNLHLEAKAALKVIEADVEFCATGTFAGLCSADIFLKLGGCLSLDGEITVDIPCPNDMDGQSRIERELKPKGRLTLAGGLRGSVVIIKLEAALTATFEADLALRLRQWPSPFQLLATNGKLGSLVATGVITHLGFERGFNEVLMEDRALFTSFSFPD